MITRRQHSCCCAHILLQPRKGLVIKNEASLKVYNSGGERLLIYLTIIVPSLLDYIIYYYLSLDVLMSIFDYRLLSLDVLRYLLLNISGCNMQRQYELLLVAYLRTLFKEALSVRQSIYKTSLKVKLCPY